MSSREISNAKQGKEVFKKEQVLPAWFTGRLYPEGDTVENPYSGECYTLTNVELSMYDFLNGCSLVDDSILSPQLKKDFRKGLDWFRKTNSNAYMVLLD